MTRIVLLGATGYTGRLIAEQLVGRGLAPLLAGRSASALDALAATLGGGRVAGTAVVTLDDPRTIARLLSPGDVLITTVGPFLTLGHAALTAALDAGAHYVDTTGEAPFVRHVFRAPGAAAAAKGCALLPAFGYDFVPGNLAGALALERAGEAAERLDVGYFFLGDTQTALSGGTQASAAGVLTEPGFTFAGGRVVEERCGARIRRYDVQGQRRPGLTLGSSEVLTLPARFPHVVDIDVHQGGLGAVTPLVAQVGRVAAVPSLARAVRALAGKLVKGSTGGPDAESRSRSATHVVAIASDRAGRFLEQVVVQGPNVYDATAATIAWSADRIVAGGLEGVGALGPVDAFGLRELERGCASLGIAEPAAPAASVQTRA
ncbi:hypothetical protein DSM112329_03677 [Paraconexibacter sp. AEG42_29]|uniref:Saccharopine dehydrogenase NADP binding domain-containing protein n=1 Tax=Paraconexibacter sp. AEG42_29 TaxID=2997339 RepID=A0AAU7AYU0_9ACTN